MDSLDGMMVSFKVPRLNILGRSVVINRQAVKMILCQSWAAILSDDYYYYYYSEYSGAIREPMTITVTVNAQQNIKITFTNFIYLLSSTCMNPGQLDTGQLDTRQLDTHESDKVGQLDTLT